MLGFTAVTNFQSGKLSPAAAPLQVEVELAKLPADKLPLLGGGEGGREGEVTHSRRYESAAAH